MKKIDVCYHISFEVEIPDEDFYKAMSKEGLDRGTAFNHSIANNCKEWWKNLPPDSEITGVYNSCYVDKHGNLAWAQPEDDEIYWEG